MATKKTASKKAATKKSATKTATAAVKKTAAKKAATKAATKKTPAKKTTAKKAATKKAPAKVSSAAQPILTTTVVAKCDAGFGNELFLRGDGPGLSWEKGAKMDCIADNEWVWSSTGAKYEFEAKILLNDSEWMEGPNLIVVPGEKSLTEPSF